MTEDVGSTEEVLHDVTVASTGMAMVLADIGIGVTYGTLLPGNR